MFKKNIVFAVSTILLPLALFAKINGLNVDADKAKPIKQVQTSLGQTATQNLNSINYVVNSKQTKNNSVESPLYNILSISEKFEEPLSEYVQKFLSNKDDNPFSTADIFYDDSFFAGPAKAVAKPRASIDVKIDITKYEPYFDVVIVVNTAKKGKFAKKAHVYLKNNEGQFVYDRQFSVLPGRGIFELAPGNAPIQAPPGYELAVPQVGTVPPHYFWSITEAGFYPAQLLDKNHISGSYGGHPMPNSVFFNMGQGQASHQGSLGDSGSAGCIRMSMKNSEYVFNLVAKTRAPKDEIPKINQFTGEFTPAADGSENIEMNSGVREKSGKVTKLFGYKALYIINNAPEEDYSKLLVEEDADAAISSDTTPAVDAAASASVGAKMPPQQTGAIPAPVLAPMQNQQAPVFAPAANAAVITPLQNPSSAVNQQVPANQFVPFEAPEFDTGDDEY